jgi:hypothetical protein
MGGTLRARNVAAAAMATAAAVALAISSTVVGQAAGGGQAAPAQGQGAQTPAPGRGAGPGAAAAQEPPPAPRAAAPIDLTGYWVSVITEDWRWRMITPPKGDYISIPITAEAKKVADAWDPAQDQASDPCKAYGPPGLMRLPGRLNLSWQDDTTLKVETDAGRQTRLFHFGDWKSPGGEPTRQGETVATWETRPGRRGQPLPPPDQRFGSLKTVTTRMTPGYLRKNGIPYSDKTTLTEYWDLLRQTNGDRWLVVTTVVEDPTYLSRTWITSLNFKKEPNGSKWDPSDCSVK